MLDQREDVIWKGHPSIFMSVPHWAVALTTLVLVEFTLGGLLGHVSMQMSQLSDHPAARIVLSEAGLRALGTSVIFLIPVWKTLSILSTNYIISQERLFVGTGVLARRFEQIELFRVRDITMAQSLIQRLLRIGTVTVYSQDTTMPTCRLWSVPAPFDLADDLRSQVFKAKEKRGLKEFEVT